jgi:hypothetical protein
MLHIRIRIQVDPKHFGKPDPNLHQSEKQDPDLHQSKKPDQNLHQSEKPGAVEAHNGAMEAHN